MWGTILQEHQGEPLKVLPNVVMARTWRASKLASDKTQFVVFRLHSRLQKGEKRLRHN